MKLRTYLRQVRGRTTALAQALGVTISMVSMWANKRRPVPAEMAFRIERMTKGAVSVEGLCPGVNFNRVTLRHTIRRTI